MPEKNSKPRTDSSAKIPKSWRETLSVYWQLPILWVFLLGIASGFPLLLTASTLAARLTESGVDIQKIGLFALIGLPYTFKFLLAPIVDALHLTRSKSHLTHRKSWCVLIQVLLALALCAMAVCDPARNTVALAIFALMTATFSAMQDIVIDALRIELLTRDAQGAGAAASVAGYRVGMLFAGAGALVLAVYLPWRTVYFIAGAVMLAAVGVTLSIRRLEGVEASEKAKATDDKGAPCAEALCGESHVETASPAVPGGSKMACASPLESNSEVEQKSKITADFAQSPDEKTRYRLFLMRFAHFLNIAVVAPLKDFWTHPAPLATLLFIATFKLSDAMAGTLSVPFYLMLGFTKVDIAAVTKLVGVIAVLLGTFIGGFMVKRRPMYESLVVTGLLQIASNFVFVWLAFVGNDIRALTLCIIVENVTGGMGTAAFVAFMAQLCNIRFTATQYALLSSISSVGRTFLSSSAGFLVAQLGWAPFYVISAILGLPGMFFLWRLYLSEKRLPSSSANSADTAAS